MIGWTELRYQLKLPVVTKCGQWTLNNKVSWKLFFTHEQPGEKNGRENHFGANLNKAEIATASPRHKSKCFRSALQLCLQLLRRSFTFDKR